MVGSLAYKIAIFLSMMWNWGYDMMGWGGGFGWLFGITWIVWLVVGVLLAVWLWQKISKNK
ncbi:MAG: hypothetical protein Q8P12_05705 [bacterium]|nr:hypothetical protein [bacterium]